MDFSGHGPPFPTIHMDGIWMVKETIARGEFEKSERIYSLRNTGIRQRRAGQGFARVYAGEDGSRISSLGPRCARKGT
jgi:hypothetical protein